MKKIMESYVFKNNRKKITDEMINDSIFIVFSKMCGKDDIFKQSYNINRNFYYASGIMEFDDILIMTKLNGKASEMLFIQPYDELKAKWVGATLSKEEAIKASGIEIKTATADRT